MSVGRKKNNAEILCFRPREGHGVCRIQGEYKVKGVKVSDPVRGTGCVGFINIISGNYDSFRPREGHGVCLSSGYGFRG